VRGWEWGRGSERLLESEGTHGQGEMEPLRRDSRRVKGGMEERGFIGGQTAALTNNKQPGQQNLDIMMI
jgi:hypothetical protein